MRRALILGVLLLALAVLIGGGVGLILSHQLPDGPSSAETFAVAVTETPEPTQTASTTPTVTPTATATATHTPTATFTATLTTLVVQVTAINPDVTLDSPRSVPPTLTPSPHPTEVVPSPIAQIAFMPTGEPPPVTGWVRYPADHPAIQRSGAWEMYTRSFRAARTGYLYTNDPGATLTLRFLGAATRIRHPRLFSYGVFEVRIDGRVATTVDAYLSRRTSGNGDFATTEVFGLANGWHTLEIRHLNRRNPYSSNTYIAIDAVDIYQNGPAPTTAPSAAPVTPTLTPSPAPVQRIDVLIAPPTIPATTTPAPPQVSGAALTVAYDLNGNRAVDPGEGVVDLPVQLIAADTNRVVAEGRTDSQGYAYLETTGTAPLRLAVPYFNRLWDVQLRTPGTRITLLLPPANRPGLIP